MNHATSLTRRQAIAFGTSILATGLFPSIPARASSKGTNISVLSDGNLSLPLEFLYPDAPKDELVKLLQDAGRSTQALTPECNLTLYEKDDRLVLFDVGAGPNFMPTAGSILESLEAAGRSPDEITDVVFTHAHPDHIWGLVDDFDELVFADANYHINRNEWDYWKKDDTLEKTPEARRSFVVGARNRFEYLEDRVSLFGFGDEVLPGIEAIDTSGHTPGHTSFLVHEATNKAMIIGDALTNDLISFSHPEWPSGSDQDPEKAVITRKKLLDRLSLEKSTIIGYHLPNGGMGRVEPSGNAYRFVQ